MSSRAQQAQIIRSQPVLDQLTGSLLNAAFQVSNEAATTANHKARAAYANQILASPQQQAQFMAPALMTNATLLGQAGNAVLSTTGTPFADADVDFVVNSVFTQYALQFTQQQNSGALLAIVA